MLAAVVLAASATLAAPDPRAQLTPPQVEGRLTEALERTEALLDAGGDDAAALGLDYLRGHLLDQLGRPGEAAEAYARAIVRSPELEMYSRYRMALAQERGGHPEVAAGLVATVVGRVPGSPLVPDATRLLARTLEAGGDCRLLGGIDLGRLPDPQRRTLTLARADCARREDPERARTIYLSLLRQNREDEPARCAAERLLSLVGGRPSDALAQLLGATFYWHRQFELSKPLLEQTVSGFDSSLTADQLDTLFMLARNHFWQEDHRAAAAMFGHLAGRSGERGRTARALVHQGRSLELAGLWPEAAALYRSAYAADPLGRSADSALLAALRIDWRSGAEAAALELFDRLVAERRWVSAAARAALYLASSDLVAGRRDRAGRWLDLAERAGGAAEPEVPYWRGRLAELDGEADAAVVRYLRVLERDPFHPLARDAARRLARPELAAVAERLGRQLAAGNHPADWYRGWLLLGDGSPAGRAAYQRLRGRLANDRVTGPILTVAPVPVADWPLWRATLREPEEMLLALGIWNEGAPAVADHFPLSSPDLGYTGAVLLKTAGETRRAIARAEVLRRRAGRGVEPELLPGGLRRLLYPFAHSELLVENALRRGVDPYLLAAIIREESRFDAEALSPAAARGLTQFVVPTAERLARQVGLGAISPEDLYKPAVSIALGAAYLRELLDRFGGLAPAAVASYNAGEPQAELWRRHCFSTDGAEYFTKISFTETREYVERVLGSWAQYRDIYRERQIPAP
jgi:soluble lytic murein transglycosylase